MPRPALPILALMLSFAGLSAQANTWCEELWLSRNTVFDRTGQCFATPLGRAVFDNAGCTGAEASLLPLDTAIVTQIASLEAQSDCAVDTEATALSEAVEPLRRRLSELWTVPIRADTEHGCGGYRGRVRELHAGISTATTVIGRLEPGQSFTFAHAPMPLGWEYVRVSNADGGSAAHGWVQGIEMTEELCTFMAG